MSKTAKCERTGKVILINEGFFAANQKTGEWSFVCTDAPEASGDYNVYVPKILSSPEGFCDWMAHLNDQSWFKAKLFMDFFTRFRKDNKLFGSML